jgi:hypothetical protein
VSINKTKSLDPNLAIPHLFVNPSADAMGFFIPDLFE